jgi:hypothetical protein
MEAAIVYVDELIDSIWWEIWVPFSFKILKWVSPSRNIAKRHYKSYEQRREDLRYLFWNQNITKILKIT